MTHFDIPHQTSPIYNVQPTSNTSETRIFPSLPYTSENLKFINKFNFQVSDRTDTECITLCNMLLKYKTCYATHKNDKKNLKLVPEKSFFVLLKVQFLGHEIGHNTIKPIHSKIAAIHKIPSPTGKVALMSFIGTLNFYTKFIEKLHINLKPFYGLLHENTPWKWKDEHERLFQKLKMSLTSDT